MTTPRIPTSVVLRHPIHWLAFGLGTGLSPYAPGTVGTLVGVPVALVLACLPIFWQLVAIAVLCLAGVYICGASARRLGFHDHPGIVFDEIAGYQIVVVFLPNGWITLLTGFVLFRFFDILKPWPIGWLDRRVGGGTGIMLDDIAAGAYAGLIGLGIATWTTLI